MKVARPGVPTDCSPALATSKPSIAQAAQSRPTLNPGPTKSCCQNPIRVLAVDDHQVVRPEVGRLGLSQCTCAKHSNQLSACERGMLAVIAEGLTNEEIANLLGKSVRRVEMHRERLMRKLHTHGVADLTKFAISSGWLLSDKDHAPSKGNGAGVIGLRAEIEIYDTTLRDGSQGEGINFSVIDKLQIAEKLDAFGIHYIEGGWPGSNPKDIEFFAKAKRQKFKHARLAAFGSTRRKGAAVENDDQLRLLLEAETPVITIYGKTWLLHVKEVLRAAPDENLGMIADTIRFLKDQGRFVIYDAEHAFDGYKQDPEYAVATWQAAERAGVDRIVLCDTNGGALPGEISRITTEARRKLTVGLGIHTHNDIGLGLANALVGLEAGATHVQGTINGYGERTGNCNLISVIPTLALKMGKRCLPDSTLRKLKDLSQFVDEIANIRPDLRQPWVGEAAFAHKGGTHVNGVQKVAQSYEHIDPARIGNARRVLVSDLAGRSNIVMKGQELGFDLGNDTPELSEILSRVKKLEHEGYEFEAAEGSLALMIRKILKPEEAPFKIDGFHVSIRRERSISVCQARVKVLVDGVTEHTIVEGRGPVDALDHALRNALVKFYPQLKKVRLAHYKVRILDSTSGTGARTRVLIESTDGKDAWGTVGVHDNIIEASLQALSDSLEYRLMKR